MKLVASLQASLRILANSLFLCGISLLGRCDILRVFVDFRYLLTLTDTSWDREKHLHDPNDKALAFLPLVILTRDLSNYNKWLHALWFHVVYHRLVPFVMPQRKGPLRYSKECPEGGDEDNWTRRMLHAYVLVFYSVGNNVLEDMAADKELEFNPFDDLDYLPYMLMHKVEVWQGMLEERARSDEEETDESGIEADGRVSPVEDEFLVELRMWRSLDEVFN